MRSGIWFFAICGIVGLALTAGSAQERRSEDEAVSFDGQDSRRSIDYFSRSGRLSRQEGKISDRDKLDRGSSRQIEQRFSPRAQYTRSRNLTDAPPKSLSNTALPGAEDYRRELFGPAGSSRRTLALPGTGREDFPNPRLMPTDRESRFPRTRNSRNAISNRQEPADDSSEVIHAEYKRRLGMPARGEVRQVRATESNTSPFLAPEAIGGPDLPAESPATSAPSQVPQRVDLLTFHTMATELDESSSGSRQAPTVLVRWVKQSHINIGQECECDLVVKNTSQIGVTDVSVEAYFPKSVQLVSSDPLPVSERDSLAWEFETLAPGEEQTIKIRMVPSERGELATTAFVRFTGTVPGLFHVEEPLLKLHVKGPKQVMLGDPASQIVMVSNPGTGVAGDVLVEATIPQGLEHPRGERLIMKIGSLNPGETRLVRLALASIEGGLQTIRIEAKSGAVLKQRLSTDVQVISPSIKVDIHGPALRYVGRMATFELIVSNNGAVTSDNVRAVYKIPDGFRFGRAKQGGKFDKSTNAVNWFVGRLESGQTAKLKLALMAIQPGTYLHQGGALSEHGARASTQFESHVEGTASLVLEIIDLDDPVEVGAETAYEVRVRNEGSKAAQNVGISCELPAGVELIQAKGPAKHLTENGLVVFKSLPELSPGKTAIYRIHVRGNVGGNHRFRVRLASDSIREPLIFEELTKFYDE